MFSWILSEIYSSDYYRCWQVGANAPFGFWLGTSGSLQRFEKFQIPAKVLFLELLDVVSIHGFLNKAAAQVGTPVEFEGPLRVGKKVFFCRKLKVLKLCGFSNILQLSSPLRVK